MPLLILFYNSKYLILARRIDFKDKVDKTPMPILLDSTHFHEIRQLLKARSVAWDALARAEELDPNDAELAKGLEKVIMDRKCLTSSADETSVSMESNADQSEETPTIAVDVDLVNSLINLLSQGNADVVKAIQNIIAEMLCDESNASALFDTFRNNRSLLDRYFVSCKLSECNDEQTLIITVYNMVSLLIIPDLYNTDTARVILTADTFQAVFTNIDHQDTCYICLRLLQELAAAKKYRSLVWEYHHRFLPTVFRILGSKSAIKPLQSGPGIASSAAAAGAYNTDTTRPMIIAPTHSNNLTIQLHYYSLMLIWVLTFDAKIAQEITTNYLSSFLQLLKLVRVTIKEKIIRLCVAIILQCCSVQVKNHRQVVKHLLLLGDGLSAITTLSERKFSDDELKQDINTLREILESEYQELSSFDEYVAELDSKLLCWSPPHIDNGFWAEHIDKFKEHNWKLLRELMAILMTLDKVSTTVIQVALSDITHVVELLPESVDVLRDSGAKIVIMELLNHSDSRVKYEALKATQAIIGYTFKPT